MAIYVKNPEVERKARELAARTGESVTAMLDRLLTDALDGLSVPEPRRRARTMEDIDAAIARFRKRIGLDGPVKVSKAEWDELNAISGFDPDEEFLKDSPYVREDSQR